MNEIISQLLIQTGIYFFVFVTGVLILNFLTKGFIFTYLRVKGSRGKNILIKALSNTNEWFYVVGKPFEGFIKFKLNGVSHTSRIEKSLVSNEMGVKTSIWDEETDQFVNFNFAPSDPNTTAEVDGLLARSLKKPVLDDMSQKIMLIAVVINVLVSIVCLYLIYTLGEKIENIGVI